MLHILLIGLFFHEGNAQSVCSWNIPINDTARNLFLEAHNTYRAYVARGEAYHKIGKLDGSINLFEMKYDCYLELMATMDVHDCNVPSNLPANSVNRFSIEDEPYALSERELILTTISSWYREILRAPLTNSPSSSDGRLRSFSKMINHKSLMVGCSYNRCPSSSTAPTTYLVACVYSAVPSGQIYIPEITQGCDDNSRCSKQVANSTCIKEGPYRGLCSQGSATATPMTMKSMEKLMATILTSNRGLVH